jgi:outer membrane receptor protein involved in Fe transport
VLQPHFIPGLNATVDWWEITVKDAVEEAGADLTMQTCIETGDPLFCSRIHRDSTGSLWLTPDGFVDDRLINIAGFKVRGIDVGTDYQHRIGRAGKISANFVGSYTIRWIIAPGGLFEPFDCVGKFGGDCGIPTPRWRHKARLTWTGSRGVSLSANWRYSGAMRLTALDGYIPGPFARQIRPQSFFDLAAVADIRHRYAVRLGVNNIFDREPPLVPSGNEQACGFGCNGNTYTQWYDPLGRFIFAGVTLNLKPF